MNKPKAQTAGSLGPKVNKGISRGKRERAISSKLGVAGKGRELGIKG